MTQVACKIVYTDARTHGRKSRKGQAVQSRFNDRLKFWSEVHGQNSSSDGTKDSCSSKQIKEICSVHKSLFVSDVSAGKVKIVKQYLFWRLASFTIYTFGVHSKGVKSEGVSFEQAKQNVTKRDRQRCERYCE